MANPRRRLTFAEAATYTAREFGLIDAPPSRIGPKTVEGYWDCECNQAYIWPKSVKACPRCQCVPDEQPDAIREEVIIYWTTEWFKANRALAKGGR